MVSGFDVPLELLCGEGAFFPGTAGVIQGSSFVPLPDTAPAGGLVPAGLDEGPFLSSGLYGSGTNLDGVSPGLYGNGRSLGFSNGPVGNGCIFLFLLPIRPGNIVFVAVGTPDLSSSSLVFSNIGTLFSIIV